MAWTKKPAAPSSFNLQAAIAALITGDSVWAWLLDWLPLVPQVTVDTAALCAAGPRTVAPFTAADFVSDPHLAFDRALSQLGPNIDRIQSAAYDRVFGAYCENIVPSGPPSTVTIELDVPVGGAYPAGFQPGGATHVTIETVSLLSGTSFDYNFQANHTATPSGAFVDRVIRGINTTPGQILGADWTPSWEGFDFANLNTGGAHVRMVWTVPNPGGTFTHAPTPQAQPAGVLAPITNVYGTVADLGAELDRQELKLDIILGMLNLLSQRGIVGPTSADPPVPVTGAPVIAPGAIGYRIDVSGIPAGAGEMFGTPVKYHRIGRYTLGSANGFLPAIELEHAQTLVAALPPGVDRIQVVVNAPATATVTALYPPKVV